MPFSLFLFTNLPTVQRLTSQAAETRNKRRRTKQAASPNPTSPAAAAWRSCSAGQTQNSAVEPRLAAPAAPTQHQVDYNEVY